MGLARAAGAAGVACTATCAAVGTRCRALCTGAGTCAVVVTGTGTMADCSTTSDKVGAACSTFTIVCVAAGFRALGDRDVVGSYRLLSCACLGRCFQTL